MRDRLNQARLEQGHTYQTIAKQIPNLSTPQVREVFETESPDLRQLHSVMNFLGVKEDLQPAIATLSTGQPSRSKKAKKQVIERLREQVKEHQDKSTLKLAKGESCVRCGSMDGTVVSCHYTGIRQHLLGKGTGQKCHDLASAFLCSTCHAEMDQPKERKSVEASEEFLYCIVQTLIRKAEK